MFPIEDWSKERVHGVMQELLFSLNYMWFLMEEWIKQNCPEKIDSEEFRQLSDQFGAYEAKRLEKTVDDPGKGVNRLMRFLEHSHWCAFEEIQMEKISEKCLRMRTLGCTAQKAVKKWGMPYYDCSKTGLRLRQGFFGRIDPTARVERILTPPDDRPKNTPEDVSCEWMIIID